MKKRAVIWTDKAIASLELFCEYIHQDSPSAAKRVKVEIKKATRQLETFAEMYQLDDYYGSSELSIRRFFKWSYRIVYQVLENEVVILNVYHTHSQ